MIYIYIGPTFKMAGKVKKSPMYGTPICRTTVVKYDYLDECR